MKDDCTKERFLRDVANHKMTILKDDGVYRHILFAKPDSSNMAFELVTWPNFLSYTGDMGAYTFSRTNDMFTFFRREDGELSINTGYWGEKCEAVDRISGIHEYSPEMFIEVVNEQCNEWIEDCELTGADAEKLREEIEDLKGYADDGEAFARNEAENFWFVHEGRKLTFNDFFETTLTKKTFRFVWCCYAIEWGISLYDKEKSL
jgi:hypothetical protein